MFNSAISIKKLILAAFCLAGLVLVFLYFRNSSLTAGPLPPRAENGVIDLTGWDFAGDGAVKLDGVWEFYWKQLLTPDDFAGPARPRMTGYINVPGLWNGYQISDGGQVRKLSGDSYATYRLLVKTNNREDLLGLKILDFATSYRMWINGKLLASM